MSKVLDLFLAALMKYVESHPEELDRLVELLVKELLSAAEAKHS